MKGPISKTTLSVAGLAMALLFSTAAAGQSASVYTSERCSCLLTDEMAARRWTASTRGYQVSTMVHAGIASLITAGNFIRPGHTGLAIAGVAVGSAGIGLAASHLSNPHAPTSYAAVNGFMAAATIASTWRSARAARVHHAATIPATIPATSQTAGVQISPVISPTTAGMSISFR